MYGPIPLVIGVMGHRDLRDEDRPALEAAVRGELARMRAQYPATPITVLSSLAEGADRLAARVALDVGCNLVVPLPMLLDEYERDFSTQNSIDEFRSLLARAECSFTVPSETKTVPSAEDRSDAYARCAAYVARNCIELIALWDGRPGTKRGSTAQGVSFKLDGVPAPYVHEADDLDPALVGPVHHVLTPREHAAVTSEVPAAMRTLYPPLLKADEAKDAFEKLKTSLDRFNADAVRGYDGGRWTLTALRERLEQVAALYQRRVVGSLNVIFVLVFFAAIGLNFYLFLPRHPLLLLIGYLALSAVAYGIFRISKKADWQDRYQDARAMGEALRVVFFWRLAGIHDSVADMMARAEHGEIDWLPPAVRSVAEMPGAYGASKDWPSQDAAMLIEQQWIDHQCRYFTFVAGKRERAHQRLANRTTTVVLIFSVGISVAIKLLQQVDIVNAAIAFGSSLLALGAGLLGGYTEKRGWSEHARRYDRMASIFSRAREALAASVSEDEGRRNRSILRRLGREAIAENMTWLTQQRTRKISVPHT